MYEWLLVVEFSLLQVLFEKCGQIDIFNPLMMSCIDFPIHFSTCSSLKGLKGPMAEGNTVLYTSVGYVLSLFDDQEDL